MKRAVFLIACAVALAALVGSCAFAPDNGVPLNEVNWRLNVVSVTLQILEVIFLCAAAYGFWRFWHRVAAVERAAARLHELIDTASKMREEGQKRWDETEMSLQKIRLDYLNELHRLRPGLPDGGDAPV